MMKRLGIVREPGELSAGGGNRDLDWKRIRKDDSELVLEDFQEFPVWEYALDEEGKPGQSETTMRPVKTTGPLDYPHFMGCVAIEMRFADGTVHAGTFETWQDPEARWRAVCYLWLPPSAQEFAKKNAPEKYNRVLNRDDIGVMFILPEENELSNEDAKRLISLVYSALDTTPERMWPINVTPCVRLSGWPASWQIPGWRRFAKSEQHSAIIT